MVRSGVSRADSDDRVKGRLLAVSDDRERPRLLLFDVRLAPTPSLTWLRSVPLERPPPGRRTLDAEGVAPAPGGHVFIASEGDASNPEAPTPGIFEYTGEGRFVRSLPLPPAFAGRAGNSGLRTRRGIEGLAVSPSRRYLFAATESSLRQDADESNFEHGTLVRLIAYDLPLAAAAREYAYPLDPIPRPSRELRDPIGSIGVSEVMALSDKDLLVLERSFVEERNSSPRRHATTVRVYRVTLEGSAELGGRMSLRGSPPVVPLKKTLVVDGAELAPRLGGRLRQLENFEVMSAGPRLPGGCSSLLFLSDDNFSAEQVTALVVLSSPAPGPTTTPAARIRRRPRGRGHDGSAASGDRDRRCGIRSSPPP